MKYLKPYNESIRQYLKPKSEKEIGNVLYNSPNLSDSQKILKASEYGILWIVKKLSDKAGNLYFSFIKACENGHSDIVEYFLNDGRINPSYRNSIAITYASKYGHHEVVKLLLNDKRVDPSVENNEPIKLASKYGHPEVVKLLLNDKRVRNSLRKEELEKYENQIQDLNESIRQHLKPKSEEEMENIFKNMSKDDKNKLMYDFINKNNLKMVLFMLNNGLEINSHMINAATTCNNLTILQLLRYTREKRKNKN